MNVFLEREAYTPSCRSTTSTSSTSSTARPSSYTTLEYNRYWYTVHYTRVKQVICALSTLEYIRADVLYTTLEYNSILSATLGYNW